MSDIAIASTRARLLRFKGRYPEICAKSGLQYSWLSKFARGARGHRPSYELMTRLQAALDGLEAAAIEHACSDSLEPRDHGAGVKDPVH